MQSIVDFETLALVVVASAVIAKILEGVKARFRLRWEQLTEVQRENANAIAVVIIGGLTWFTGLNMLPGFSTVWPPLGRILTCVAAGFGPGLLYELAIAKPKIEPRPPE